MLREFLVLSDEVKSSLTGRIIDEVMRRTGEWPYRVTVAPVAELEPGGVLNVKASAMTGDSPRVTMVALKVAHDG